MKKLQSEELQRQLEEFKNAGGEVTKVKKGPRYRLLFSSGHFGAKKSNRGSTPKTSTKSHRKLGI